MIFIQLSAFILLVMGIVRVLELTPERINKDLSGFFEKRESLQDMSRVARGKKKQNKIVKELSRIRRILTETGKEKNFSVALTLSLILMVNLLQTRTTDLFDIFIIHQPPVYFKYFMVHYCRLPYHYFSFRLC